MSIGLSLLIMGNLSDNLKLHLYYFAAQIYHGCHKASNHSLSENSYKHPSTDMSWLSITIHISHVLQVQSELVKQLLFRSCITVSKWHWQFPPHVVH